MNKTESAISYLMEQGFDKASIMDALCDGEVLKKLELDDKDQVDTENAFYALKVADL